jgi:membrane-bound lytic murein transglycosylase D
MHPIQKSKAMATAGWLIVAVTVALAGCEDSVRNTVMNHPPSIQPASKPPTLLAIGTLPLEYRGPRRAALALVLPEKLGQLAETISVAVVSQPEQTAVGVVNTGQPRTSSAEEQDTAEQDAAPAAPAAIDEIAAAAPSGEGMPESPLDPTLQGRAERELKEVAHDIPLTVNSQVLSFVDYFQTARGRAIVENGLRRAGQFREMIERVLREEGMPTDLIYLAQAESAFQPQALSRAGARGLWQFMAFRGKEYGLERSWWIDERQDPEKATRAAAAHLRDLYEEFGDWYLVMAAYNSGPGTVERAVERTGYADFWELYKRNVLPKETKNYVPIILALTLIAKDPVRYGIEVAPDVPVPTDDVQPGHPLDLRLVSESIDTDVDTLRSLNPELLRLVTPTNPDFVLHLPQGSLDRFYEQMAPIPPEKWLSWRRHEAQAGETLSSIARQYRVGVSALADANQMEPGNPLVAGQRLIVPLATTAPSSLGKLVRYRARQDDTLDSIADQFDVTVAELKKWNGLRSSRIAAGTPLKIYPGVQTPDVESVKATAPPPKGNPGTVAQGAGQKEVSLQQSVSYRVRPGETLYSIAHAYRTTVEALRSANQYLFSRPLEAGDTLVILPGK